MADLGNGFLSNNSMSTKNISLSEGERKLGEVLKKILDNSYVFSDDTILEKLYLHLCEKSKKGGNTNDVLFSWLFTVIEKWDNLKNNIKTFALKLAGAVACSSTGLHQMITSNLLLNFTKAFTSCHECDMSITSGFIEMLSEVVKSAEGCRWFLSFGLWEHVLKIHNSSRNIYTTRKSNKLIITLIVVLQEVDVESCWKIIDSLVAPLDIKKITKPLHSRQEMLMSVQDLVNNFTVNDNCEDDKNSVTEISKESTYEKERNLRIIKLLCSLLDALLEKNCSASVINIIFKNYNLYLWSWEKLSNVKQNSQLTGSLSSLILYIIYSTMPRTEEKNVVEGDLLDTLKSFLFLIQSLTSMRQYLLVNNICVQSQMLADRLISTPIYLCKEDGVTYNFRSQILFLHALPIFIFLKLARIKLTDVTDKFADKLFTSTSICVKRVCYQYRDTIRVCPQCCNTEELLRSSVQTLVGILKYLTKDHVVLVFQSLMHLLREFVPDEYTYMNKVVALESFELVRKYPNLLMDILDGIEITIKNYNITWSESLETSCVLVLLMSLACITDLTTPLNTKLLRLIHLAISNFIPPNLALLVENFKNSSLELLGPLLMRKLHDINWEVRDSSLEVLQTLASLSVLKFPAFQKLLLELNFPSVIIGMFECDEESYVRASAIVCLQKMVQVKKLWDEALVDKKLLEKMLKCLKDEPEGIVRKEAVNLITAVFINHEICSSLGQDVYKQLVLSATSDLHWEVKVNALTFWDAVIDRETANQGMIDGSFPAVTFSKKSRKIVTLTPPVIKNKLQNVLEDLEKHGCLQVLWCALNDTSDLEVAKKSAIIIGKLLKLLQQYGVVEETCGRVTVLSQMAGNNDNEGDACVSKKKHKNSENGKVEVVNAESEQNFSCADNCKLTGEEVIKSIMASQDIELLSSVYSLHFESGNQKKEEDSQEERIEEQERIVSDGMNTNDFIKVNEFIRKVTSLNLESVIKVRSDWLMASDNLDSLIDVILGVSGPSSSTDDVNAKDCY